MLTPLLFGAVDEIVPAAAADAGIGEAAIDAAERIERGLHRRFHRGGIGDVADQRASTLPAIPPW